MPRGGPRSPGKSKQVGGRQVGGRVLNVDYRHAAAFRPSSRLREAVLDQKLMSEIDILTFHGPMLWEQKPGEKREQ